MSFELGMAKKSTDSPVESSSNPMTPPAFQKKNESCNLSPEYFTH